MNTDWHFCPDKRCSHYGWVGMGNIVSNGHALAEGPGPQATARVFGVEPNTIKACLVRAATHMEAVSNYFIHHLHLTQVDELWALAQEGDHACSE